MKIPKEILEKYSISQNHLDDERGTYQTFLTATDYVIVKSYEKLMTEPLKFLTNLVEIAKENTELIKYRAIAREELNNFGKE